MTSPRTPSAQPSFYFGTSGSGKSVTVQIAIQLSTVHACVRVIPETVASLSLGVYENSVESRSKAQDHPLYPLLPDKMGMERDKTGALFYTYPTKTNKRIMPTIPLFVLKSALYGIQPFLGGRAFSTFSVKTPGTVIE